MVAYNMGAHRNASDIDGLGTELATTDTVTTNAFTLTFDSAWTNRAVDDITVSLGGGLINDAGVSVTWGAGAILSGFGKIEVNGTSGSPITWTNLTYINANKLTTVSFRYLTWSAGTSYAIISSLNNEHIIFIHVTLTSTANDNTLMLPYNGKCPAWFINCTLTAGNRLFYPTNHCPIYLFNTTISGGTQWVKGLSGVYVYIICTTNYAGAELTRANGQDMGDSVLKYYSKIKVKIDDGSNPLQNAVVTVRKKTGDGEVLFEPHFNDYDDKIQDSRTDSGGFGYVYVLSKMVIIDGTITYYSDENQAEAGDNSPYMIGAEYPAYESPAETEVWGIESGNDSTDETDVGTISCSDPVVLPRTQTNAFPTDSTDDKAKFTTGDTVYLGTSAAGGIEADAAVTNVNVQVEIYNMSDVKQGADLLNTTATLVANTEKTFYSINSDTLLSRAGLAVGDYYFKITASGGTPSVGTLVSKCYFTVDALDLPQVQVNVFPSDQTDDKGGFLPGDTVYVGLSGSGGVTSTVNVANATVQVEIYNISDVKQGSDLLNNTATLVATVEKTFYAINSNALLQRAGLTAGEYYIKTTVSGGTPTIASEISKCYFNINPSETISAETHDIGNSYTVEIGAEITVTADYTGNDDLWAEMNDVYFKMTNVSGVCTGIITTSTVRSGGPFTITVHGPSAVSKDCANPITITAQSEQTSPFVAIEAITETNFVLSGWDTPVVNDKWWKVGEKLVPQIFFDTRHDHYMEWEELTLPRNATSGVRLHSIFIVVAASTRAERWSMETEMRRIFSDPALIVNPYNDIDLIYIHDGGYSCWESEKDKKSGCATYFARFEIVVRYADGATNVD